jgi:anti-sigma28 factor (negative regulator of flagellin synthesis)
MEEATVDVALNLNPSLSESSVQSGVQGNMPTDNRDMVQLPSRAQKGSEASDLWPRNRVDRVEALRLSIASGTYQVDTAELALCILRNSTHFLETC